MHTYRYECNGRMVLFSGNDKQMKAHICNLFGTYFWRSRVVMGRKWYLFGHVEVERIN